MSFDKSDPRRDLVQPHCWRPFATLPVQDDYLRDNSDDTPWGGRQQDDSRACVQKESPTIIDEPKDSDQADSGSVSRYVAAVIKQPLGWVLSL